LKAIRAIDEQLGRELEQALRPSNSAANVEIFTNTGEPLMQCALQYSRAPMHWLLLGVSGMSVVICQVQPHKR